MSETQVVRLLRFLQEHPASSIAEITFGLQPFVANPRARISDLRVIGAAEGFVVERERGEDGVDRYSVKWLPKQTTLDLTA